MEKNSINSKDQFVIKELSKIRFVDDDGKSNNIEVLPKQINISSIEKHFPLITVYLKKIHKLEIHGVEYYRFYYKMECFSHTYEQMNQMIEQIINLNFTFLKAEIKNLKKQKFKKWGFLFYV